jgi:hypothetical protein
MEDWIEKYKNVTETLSEYGWFVAPFITGREFMEIEKVCRKIEHSLIPSADINTSINKVISPVIFHPNFRAFSVYKAITTNHLNKFSHLIDRATFHYYKKDFLSAISCLVPIVEGILLSHYGWHESSNVKKPSTIELINSFCSVPIRTLKPAAREVYSNALEKCLKNWFFANTKEFDFSNSFLNRHYIAHSLGNENFYSVLECNRMFTILDLLSQIIVLDEFRNFIFIPENEPFLDSRRDYYFNLISRRLTLKRMMEKESELLKHNKYYVSIENDIDFQQIMIDDVKRIADFHKEMDKKFGVSQKQKSIINFFRKKH